MNHELQRCDCELPGDFSSGVPGVLARMEGGRLHPEAVVERCDQCCRFESDAAARSRLVELGLADPAESLHSFTVHCFAVVRVKFPGVVAHSAKEAAQRAMDRLSNARKHSGSPVVGTTSRQALQSKPFDKR